MNRLTMFDMKKSEGRILRTALAVMLVLLVNVPSGSAAAEPKIRDSASAIDKTFFIFISIPPTIVFLPTGAGIF